MTRFQVRGQIPRSPRRLHRRCRCDGCCRRVRPPQNLPPNLSPNIGIKPLSVVLKVLFVQVRHGHGHQRLAPVPSLRPAFYARPCAANCIRFEFECSSSLNQLKLKSSQTCPLEALVHWPHAGVASASLSTWNGGDTMRIYTLARTNNCRAVCSLMLRNSTNLKQKRLRLQWRPSIWCHNSEAS